MAIELVDEFLDPDLSVEVLYTHPTSGSKNIRVVQDSPYGTTTAAHAEYQNFIPAVTARTVDIPDATDTCTITIDGTVYTIREIQPDGTGMTRLLLSTD